MLDSAKSSSYNKAVLRRKGAGGEGPGAPLAEGH